MFLLQMLIYFCYTKLFVFSAGKTISALTKPMKVMWPGGKYEFVWLGFQFTRMFRTLVCHVYKLL